MLDLWVGTQFVIKKQLSDLIFYSKNWFGFNEKMKKETYCGKKIGTQNKIEKNLKLKKRVT